MGFVSENLGIGLALLAVYWWAYLPVLLFLGFRFAWEEYIGRKYFNSLEWVLLQIKPPPASDRSLKAVEQIFNGIHGIYVAPVNWKDRIFRGKIPDWFSLEIVGSEGATNFYVRTLTQYRNLIESNIFAQYPEAEISQVADYMATWPASLPNQEQDLFGSELILAKENPYPLQTYQYFEEKIASPDYIKTIDPLSAISEVFSTFRAREHFVVQILIRPMGGDWAKEGERIIKKIQGEEKPKEKDAMEAFFSGIDKLFLGSPAKKEEKKESKRLAPHEVDTVKGIANKISKLGFETSLRLMYLSHKEIFHRHHFAAVMGALKQLVGLNALVPNKPTLTFSKGRFFNLFPSDRGFFVEQITLEKKQRLYRLLRERVFPNKYFVASTEELATLYHLPGTEVRAPLFPRVEAKKGQPPSGLPFE